MQACLNFVFGATKPTAEFAKKGTAKAAVVMESKNFLRDTELFWFFIYLKNLMTVVGSKKTTLFSSIL
jgi:hypothetical protein